MAQWVKIGFLKKPRNENSKMSRVGKLLSLPTNPNWDGGICLFKHRPMKNEKWPPDFDIYALMPQGEDTKGASGGKRSRKDDLDEGEGEEGEGDSGDDFDEVAEEKGAEAEKEKPKDEPFICNSCGERIGPKTKRCPANLPNCPVDFEHHVPF